MWVWIRWKTGKPDASAAISLKLEWTLSESSRASPRRRLTAVIQRDQLIHRGLRNPFVRWRGDTQLQQTDKTAEVTVCSSESLYEGRNKQAARTRWQRPAGGFTGISSALERKASREPWGWKKTNRNVKCFFSLLHNEALSGSRRRRRTSGKHRYLREVFEQCVCSSEKIRPSHFFKMETEGAAEWDVYTRTGPDSDDDNTHLVRKWHTPLSLPMTRGKVAFTEV